MPEKGTPAMSRADVEALIEDLSQNLGLTEALADDMLDAGTLVTWAAGQFAEMDEEEAEKEFTELSEALERHVQDLREEGYDTPMIVLGLWVHIQQIELNLRDVPDEQREEVTPVVDYLPFDERLPDTPMRPADEVEDLITDLSQNIGLTEALADDMLDAGNLVTWAATRTHDGMSPGGEAEFTDVVARFGEFIRDHREEGYDWSLIVYTIWAHVQEIERFLRLNQPASRGRSDDEEEEASPRGFQ